MFDRNRDATSRGGAPRALPLSFVLLAGCGGTGRFVDQPRLTVDKPEDARRFLDGVGNPYRRIGVDRKGATAIDFGVYGVPETYVVDSGGHIRYRQVGPLTAEDVERKILPLIGQITVSGREPG